MRGTTNITYDHLCSPHRCLGSYLYFHHQLKIIQGPYFIWQLSFVSSCCFSFMVLDSWQNGLHQHIQSRSWQEVTV